MGRHLTIMVWLLVTPLLTAAQSTIYQSTDAQGNPVFSGVPTADSEEVKLQPTNTADAVEVPPPAPETPEPQPLQETVQQETETTVIVSGSNDDWDGIYDDTARERLRDRAEAGGDSPQVNPLPSRGGVIRARNGGRR